MRTDNVKACERILRDVPKIRLSRKVREQEILGACNGNDATSAMRTVSILQDQQLQNLSLILDTVDSAIERLSPEWKQSVKLVYMLEERYDAVARKLNCDERTLRRWCIKALEQMSRDLLQIRGKVLSWREGWNSSIMEGTP